MSDVSTVHSDIQKEIAYLADHLHILSGMHIGIHNIDRSMTAVSTETRENLCNFCHEKCRGFGAKCESDDVSHLARVKDTQKTLIYQCHLGMTEVILPIIEEDDLIGVIFLGQARITPDPKMEFDVLFGNLCKKYPDDIFPEMREAVREAYDNTAVMTKEKLESFIVLTQYAAREGYVNRILNYRSVDTETSFRRYMNTLNLVGMPLGEVSVAEFAKRLNISYSQINRISLTVFGMPLKQYILQVKMEEAARMLIDRQELSVREVSSAVGIENQHYFSKLFNERIGCSPTEYRRGNKTAE